MTTEPSFAFAGPDGAVIAEGVHTPYPQLADARAALASRDVPIIVGALPFDLSQPTALVRPAAAGFADTLPAWTGDTLPNMRIAQTIPAPEVHRARIDAALQRLTEPGSDLHKVVLARALRLIADTPLDARTVLQRLATDSAATAYLVDLTPAGGPHTGTALIGASPELLISKQGDVVTCRPFAGSAPRSADPQTDRASGTELAASAKNRHEHRLVVDAMRETLEPLCVDLQIASTPQLSQTAAVWHLSTPITARLRRTSITALDLAVALHPTPAVGGVPTAAATQLINELEGDRGFYAGAVGWCDEHGDGHWVVSIRCAQLSADRCTADARSGGGIVAESDPEDEVAETTTKFNTILSALGVQP